jgi:hypothetical protein
MNDHNHFHTKGRIVKFQGELNQKTPPNQWMEMQITMFAEAGFESALFRF